MAMTDSQKKLDAESVLDRLANAVDTQRYMVSDVMGMQAAQANSIIASHSQTLLNEYMRGPRGICGKTEGTEIYTLSYCGIDFRVRILPETFDMIEDATELNGEELAFIKTMNKNDWSEIRESWAKEYQLRSAYDAFERGEYYGRL